MTGRLSSSDLCLFYLGDAPPSPCDKKPTTYSAEYLQKMGNDVNEGLRQ